MSFSTSTRSTGFVCLTGIVGALFVAACSSSVPHAEVASAKAAISGAEGAGAERVPQAALHVKMANDNLALAEKLIDQGENDEARAALQRASADAELARTMTTEAKVRNDANVATQRVEQLRARTTTF